MGTIIELFKYDFFVNAFLASFLDAISCGIVGTYIVSRRIVFISGGITHASFGGIGMGYYLGINPLIGAGIFSVLSYRDWETDRKSTRLNSSHSGESRMPSSA